MHFATSTNLAARNGKSRVVRFTAFKRLYVCWWIGMMNADRVHVDRRRQSSFPYVQFFRGGNCDSGLYLVEVINTVRNETKVWHTHIWSEETERRGNLEKCQVKIPNSFEILKPGMIMWTPVKVREILERVTDCQPTSLQVKAVQTMVWWRTFRIVRSKQVK
jgi:hypothetical protein